MFESYFSLCLFVFFRVVIFKSIIDHSLLKQCYEGPFRVLTLGFGPVLSCIRGGGDVHKAIDPTSYSAEKTTFSIFLTRIVCHIRLYYVTN